jgi:hypothetical protein
VISQITEHRRQSELCIAGLEATLDRGVDPPLRLGVPNPFAEQVGVATKILNWRERDRVDSLLNSDQAGGRKTRDPMTSNVRTWNAGSHQKDAASTSCNRSSPTDRLANHPCSLGLEMTVGHGRCSFRRTPG